MNGMRHPLGCPPGKRMGDGCSCPSPLIVILAIAQLCHPERSRQAGERSQPSRAVEGSLH